MTKEILYGIILLSMVPMRNEPSERSEMVTQLLFGDTFSIQEEENGWLHITNDYDGYEGWISKNTTHILDKETYQVLMEKPKATVVSHTAVLTEENKAPLYIVRGSSLPNYNAEDKTTTIGGRVFHFQGEIITAVKNPEKELMSFALQYLNTPYLWGGRSPYGLDCSGFTQQVAKLIDIKLPRNASQQVNKGIEINFLEEAKQGDLAFFDNEDGRITHVGVLLGKDKIIHASGNVRIDSIDHHGIYNTKLKRYTHTLRSIRRIIED